MSRRTPLNYKGLKGLGAERCAGTWLLSILSGHRCGAHASASRADGVNPSLMEVTASWPKTRWQANQSLAKHILALLHAQRVLMAITRKPLLLNSRSS